jgi:hypothetical protein
MRFFSTFCLKLHVAKVESVSDIVKKVIPHVHLTDNKIDEFICYVNSIITQEIAALLVEAVEAAMHHIGAQGAQDITSP